MLARLILAASLALSLFTLIPPTEPAHAADCAFVLGFKTIHDMIPTTVGDCLVNEHHNDQNGDGLQETLTPKGTQGLMVWRKADNWTAFTDGATTWINGPCGLKNRVNGARFPWEANDERLPVLADNCGPSTVTPPPTVTPTVTTTQSNPWGYNFTCCSLITNPPAAFCTYFSCIPSFGNGRGYVMQCRDGLFSKSGGISGSCSSHGGNSRPLLAP